MKEIWNNRYSQKNFAYGEKPNEYFKQELLKLKPGRILLPAEGEGRNAVFAAKNKWETHAFDFSLAAKEKALNLASQQNVVIKYDIAEFEDFQAPCQCFDAIAIIFGHFPANKRNLYHNKMIKLLRPGGTFILEGFSKEQINNNSGGPKNIDMLFSEEEIREDFKEMNKIHIEIKNTMLDEGKFHNGKASVIRMIAIK
jgi:cyclopropane fatty-acyl-phospholipid synthase-like methyltransferase